DDLSKLLELTGFINDGELTFLGYDGIKRESHKELVANTDMANLYGVASSKLIGEDITDLSFLDVDNALIIVVNYSDDAIALDYRESKSSPKVLANYDAEKCLRWRLVANNFQAFVDAIGIEY
ncbi:MAG: hypothetical protein MUO76_03050, partial [Anaerolineaceae bacterium]|nr:hypothetical protein [Anaerolineaceae bacterium]